MNAGRPAPAAATRRLPRRLIAAIAAVAGLLVVAGAIGGALISDRRARRMPRGRMTDAGTPWIAILVVSLAVATAIGVLVWRRVSRPMGELLGAASRVGPTRSIGGIAVPVAPVPIPTGTPRELRSLIETFNAMTARIDRTEQERRRFLADVTHELRTPLTVLRSGIEAQIDGVHVRDDAHLASLLEETVILGRLIDDLHALALSEAGRLDLRRAPTDVAALARDTVAAFVPNASSAGVELRLTGDEAAVATIDGGRARQVLGNLLANAIRHAPAGGHVTVSIVAAGTAPHTVAIEVHDDGPGFPPDELAHVFTRYRRAADSGGSGLGLTIAHDLVVAHGGTITAANHPDGGAVIRVVLPMG